ncbi:DnaJ-like subfamily C member 14 [Spatholobus suberectus]|nr:DnaJ-like subfamily C member 14 [Spatholobus suberectus]
MLAILVAAILGLILITTVYSVYCACLYVGWLGLLLAFNTQRVSCLLKSNQLCCPRFWYGLIAFVLMVLLMARTRGTSDISRNQRGRHRLNNILPRDIATQPTPTLTPAIQPTPTPTIQPSPAPTVQATCTPLVHPTPISASHDRYPSCTSGWTPDDKVVRAIGHAIKSQFRGLYHCYEAVPEDSCDFHRPVDPDELFMATHTKKDGGWIDSCAQ